MRFGRCAIRLPSAFIMARIVWPCCWGLMAIQLALGIMSVPLMLVVAAVILLEKGWRHGEALASAAGVVAIAGGVILVLRATIRS